jgi:spermidine/putrescine transport system ATP-binding protein
MSDAVAAVEVVGVSKRFGDGPDAVIALDEVSLALRPNELFTLLGPSGCGKTTLLRLVAGFEQPSAGEILIAGRPVAGLPPNRRPVNTVFQSYALFPHMTVAQNIAFGLEMRRRPAGEIRETVAAMLALVRLEGLEQRRPAQLSGGQQQRVALARALANRPEVLLLDEPLSALDLKLRKEMQVELKRIQHETGLAFIFVTHDQGEALAMSDRIAVMSKGRVLQIGTPAAIYEHPTDRFVADFIGEINFLQATVLEVEPGAARVRLASGAVRRAQLPPAMRPAGEVTLAVRPERLALAPADDAAAFLGAIAAVTYLGAETLYEVQADAARPIRIRLQNSGAGGGLSVGARVGIAVPDGAPQVLAD